MSARHFGAPQITPAFCARAVRRWEDRAWLGFACFKARIVSSSQVSFPIAAGCYHRKTCAPVVAAGTAVAMTQSSSAAVSAISPS
jgi:hypothetical protein